MEIRLLLGLMFIFGLFWIMGFLSHILAPAAAIPCPKWLWIICGAPPTGQRLTADGVASQVTAYCILPVLIYWRAHWTLEQGLLAFVACGVITHILVLGLFRVFSRR